MTDRVSYIHKIIFFNYAHYNIFSANCFDTDINLYAVLVTLAGVLYHI